MSDSETRTTLDVVRRFNEAFNRHDVDGVMALMTADCVFENTLSAPDGERFEGAAAGIPLGRFERPRARRRRHARARRQGGGEARVREGLRTPA